MKRRFEPDDEPVLEKVARVSPLLSFLRAGSTGKVVVFDLPPAVRGWPRVIIAGLYPPADARADAPHDNVTSRELVRTIGHARFAWVDFTPVSAHGSNAGIDQAAIAKKATESTLVADFHLRLVGAFNGEREAGNVLGVLYLAGRTVSSAFDAMVDRGLVLRLGVVDAVARVSLCKTPLGCRFLALEGRAHPSTHLMARFAPKAVAEYRETCRLLRVLSAPGLHQGVGDATTLEALVISFDACALVDDAAAVARSKLRPERRRVLASWLYETPEHDGWFED